MEKERQKQNKQNVDVWSNFGKWVWANKFSANPHTYWYLYGSFNIMHNLVNLFAMSNIQRMLFIFILFQRPADET